MRTKKAKGVVLAVLSLFCGAAVIGGVAAQKTVPANAEDIVLFERDFESLSVNATADEIYGATWVAGPNRSVVEAEKDYIEAIYTFFDNGCQHAGLYLDSNRGISSTDVNKTYTLELEFQMFGSSVKNTILGLQAPDGAYNGVVKFENGAAIAENYGSVSDFITLVSATQDANGWWKATIQLKGTGGYIFPIFWMNIDPAQYETVNAALDTGLRLAEFKVTEGENSIYDLTVTPGLIGTDALFGATGFAGGTSVATKEGAGIEGKSIKAAYTFWDNGWQHEALYINENNVNARLEEGKQYVVEMDVEKFGHVEQVYCIFNQVGIDGTTDSQIVLEKNGTYNTYEWGSVKMFESIDVTNNGDTYHIKATINGAGGLLKFYFNMLSNNYEDANAKLNTGLYLDNLKITEKVVEIVGDSSLYEHDFESLSVNATADEIYGATYVAGANRSVVEAEKDYIEAIYTFFDNGCQHSSLYLNSGRIPSTDVNKVYTLDLEFQMFGSSVKNTILGLQGPDGAYNGVVKFENGAAIAENYGSVSDFITVASATQGANGWWKATIQLKGTGGYIFPIFWMNIEPSKYEEVNAALDTGLRIAEFKVTEGENSIYDLTVTPGLVGESAVFGATGFAGGTSVATKAGAGIDGKSIKAVYTFWDNGFQHEALYINENAVNARLETGKQYVVEMDVKKFGNVEQVYCIFNQMGIDGTTDSQIVLEKNGSHNVYEHGTVKMFEDVNVTNNGDTYHIKATINGAGGLLKFYFNMLSNNYEDSNTNRNTGLYLDNVKISEKPVESDDETLPSDWKTMYAQNFNNADPSLSGGDAFFHATGFAGVGGGELTIDTAIDGTQCAKATYLYWEDEYGWQKEPLYLNSGYTSNTSTDSMYKASMKIKPFGNWTAICVGFQNPEYVTGWLTLNPDGSFVVDKTGCLLDAEVTLENGVFTVTAYLQGTGSWIFNQINMAAANPVEANANKDTGLYFDDYVFAQEVKAIPAGVNKKAAYYNKATEGDFITSATFTAIDSIMIGETALSEEQYTFANGILTIKEAALDALANGSHTVTVTSGSATVEMQLVVASTPLGSTYTNDFSGMPELAGGQEAKDNFFFNSYFDPANYNIWTVDEGENRMIKFVAPDANDAFVNMFQTNPQEARLSSLSKNKVHTVYMDFKPENGTVLGIEGRIFDGGADVPYFYMEIDFATNTRVDNNTQSSDVSWTVTAKDNGWYTLAITFSYTGDYSEKASAYLRFSAPASEQDVWYFDNFDAQSELIPELRSEKNTYDVGADTAPYYIIDLYRTFDIESITVNGTALTASDYTVEVTPVGYTRIDFAKAYCANYNLGDEATVVIKTTKGNEITSKFTVVDSRPALAVDSFDYDKATAANLAVSVDFKGYELATIEVAGATLTGTEYNYNSESGVIDFKGAYLAKLAVGSNVFTVTSSSGATCQFTIVVSDSTPVFGTAAVYEKSEGGDYAVAIELNGKEITSVQVGALTLTADQYSYANGQLTIAESVMNGLAAGKYNITVTTLVSATVEVTVNDAPPVFSGEYTATQGQDLVISVEIYNKTILSITVDGLVLLADEYSYSDGKLTIKGSVFEEIAVGEKELVLTTEGGEAILTFTLQVAGANGDGFIDQVIDKINGVVETVGEVVGCNSSVGMLSAGVTVLAAAAIVLKKKED